MAEPNSSPKRSTSVLPLLAVVLLIGGAVMVLRWVAPERGSSERGPGHPIVGQSLRVLKLEPLTGDAAPRRTEHLEGKVTLINYWGTWCPPCLREFPHVADIARRYSADARFQLLSVSCPGSPDQSLESLRDETQQHLDRYQADFPTYYEAGDTMVSLAMLLDASATGIPMTFVVDAEGTIRGYWMGYQVGDEVAVERLVRELLAEPKRGEG